MKKYVQYGCGLSTPEQWENYDSSPSLIVQRLPIIGGLLSKYIQTKGFGAFPDNVLLGDIIKGLPVADESCDGVYCSHTLEHLSLEDFRVSLRNSYKILKKDGIFRCVVPDLAWAARKYVAALDAKNPQASLDFLGEDTLLGAPHRPKGFLQKLSALFGNHHHLWMWDSVSMKEELRKAGFREIRDCKFNDSTDEMFKYVENPERFVNAVAIECRK